MAQLVAHLHGMQGVRGSSPLRSTLYRHSGPAAAKRFAERGIVAKADTRPWETDAVRAVLTAVLLPVVIWQVTSILERFGV